MSNELHYGQTAGARLHRALWNLVGPDTFEDLEKMEVAIRLLPVPEEDRVVSLDAIHALKAMGRCPEPIEESPRE